MGVIQFPPMQVGETEADVVARNGDGYHFYPGGPRGATLIAHRWNRAVEELVRTEGVRRIEISPAWTLPTLDALLPYAEQWEAIGVKSAAVTDLGALARFPKLGLLSVGAVTARVPFAALHALRECTVSETTSLGTLHEAPGLVELSLSNVKGLRDLRAMSSLATLRSLTLSGLAGAFRLDGIEGLALTDLWLRYLTKLPSVGPLAGLPLRELHIDNARKAEGLETIGEIATLEGLHLQEVGTMRSLEFVRDLRALQRLWLAVQFTDAVVPVAPVAELPHLRELNLSSGQRPSPGLSGFEQLGRATTLESLSIRHGPTEIPSIGWVSALRSLRSFGLVQCRIADGDLSPLLELPVLDNVFISPTAKGYAPDPDAVVAALAAAVAARQPAQVDLAPSAPRPEPLPAEPVFPLYNATSYAGPRGYSSANVQASMNASDDACRLYVSGPVDDLRAHMVHHGATEVLLSDSAVPAMLVPCADLVRNLSMGSRFARPADMTPLASLVELRTLFDPPPAADASLPRLPKLRRLALMGPHDLAPLAECTALRELWLIGVPLEDLQHLPTLPQVELLRTSFQPQKFDAMRRLPGLRTLLADSIPLEPGADHDLLAARFGDVDAIVARQTARPNRFEGSSYSVGKIRLDADEWRAQQACPTNLPEAPSSAAACIVVLIDRSRSTAQRFGYDYRIEVETHDGYDDMLAKTAYGPDGEWTIAEGIARAVNGFLRGLVQRCDANAAEVQVALIEYGARVGPAWEGALAGRGLVCVAELAGAAVREGEWVTPQWGGDTPLGEAMERAASLVAGWAAEHPDATPPVVIALDAGRHTGDDIGRHAWAIRAAATRAGNGLLFGVEREASRGFPYFGVEGNIQAEREPLFHFASPLPPATETVIREAGYSFGGPPRGWFAGASAADYENLLHLYTAVPALASPLPFVAHPIPPAPPQHWYLEQDAWRDPNAPAYRFPRPEWKVPKVKGPMTEALFWKIMDKARAGTVDLDEHGERFASLLGQLGGDDLLEFDRLFSERMAESNRWDLWAVAYIAKGGCSDDAFEYFRAWLIAQGRTYYEASLANPAHAARRIEPGDEAELEILLYAARTAYEGHEERADWEERATVVHQGSPSGDPWEEDELAALFPKLIKKYGGR